MATPVDPKGLEVFTSGEAQKVDVRSLEKELLRLWKSAVEAAESGSAQPVTRATMLTLVLVVQGDREALDATNMIARLTETTPCRALLVNRSEKESEPSLSAWASAHCHRVAGGRQVCCEQVTIEVSPSALSNVSGLLVPLFVPDLPVFVYWPDALCGSAPAEFPTLLKRIWGNVEFIVVDSSLAVDSNQAILILAEMADKRGPGHPQPRDLNWSRLLPWRLVIADQFESPERRERVREMTELLIQATSGPASGRPSGFPARPLLLHNWITGRLGWKRTGIVREERGLSVTHDREGERRSAIVLSGGEGLRGRINEVSFTFEGGGRLSIRRAGDLAMEVVISDPGRPPRTETLARKADRDVFLLGTEIAQRAADPVFLSTLIESGAILKGNGKS